MKKIISRTGKTITVDTPFKYKHYSATEKYGDADFKMKCEVGLLTRNIVFKGADEDSIGTKYGAHIMMMGSEDKGLRGRFSYFELT